MKRALMINIIICAAILLFGDTSAPSATAAAATTSGCGGGVEGSTSDSGMLAQGTKDCQPNIVGAGSQAVSSGNFVTTVDCGPVAVEGRPEVLQGACAAVHPLCDVSTAAALPTNGAHNFVVVTTNSHGHQTFDPQCGVVPAKGRPRVTPELARAQAEKLLPHPHIGTAPAGGVTLVNIETVLWVDTAPDISLGTVRLLGYRVTLRAHLQRVAWDFGDDTTDVTSSPGKAYSHADPCTTAQCPDYFGHTYTRTGQLTIGAQLSWSGQFQVDGGPWQDIPGTVTAAATGTGMHVKEARGVLVDNP
jgi:hypothetical protein